jgi:hypothetical protein
VYAGQVRRLASDDSPAPVEPVPVLTEAVNRNVRTAALGRAGGTSYAAVVTGSAGAQTLLIGAVGQARSVEFRGARLPSGTASRPVWLSLPADGALNSAMGLIAVGGRLYRFSSINPQPVLLAGVPGRVSAVAAAPDGHRVAYIASGRLFVTVVTGSGTQAQAAPPRLVRTSLRDLTGVAWSAEDLLIAAGIRPTGRVAILEANVDGAMETERLADLGNARVTGLVAHPANPTTSTGGAPAVAYMTRDAAFDALFQVRIEASAVAGVTPAADPTVLPTSPFFLQ